MLFVTHYVSVTTYLLCSTSNDLQPEILLKRL